MIADAKRSELQQIVAGLTQGVILVELDQSIAYANDAALAMHGVEQRDALGATVDEYRRNFVLRYRNHHPVATGEYPIERAIAGALIDEVVVVVRHRDRPDVDWTHRIRSLVVADAKGAPDCVALVITDATGVYEAEDRFERTFSANPAPALICRLSDLRYVKLNAGFRELTGYASEDVLGHSVYEIDALEGAEQRELAIERLNAGETIPQMEACLRLADGSRRPVIVAGQPIEIADEPCMLLTFADLQPRRKAEDALRQSEDRFATYFRLSPIPTTIVTADDDRLVDANEAFLRFTGFSLEEIVGQGVDGLGLWIDADQRGKFQSELVESGRVRGFEARLRAKDGLESDCLVSAEAVTVNDRPSTLFTVQDISGRKRSEQELVAAIEAVMADTSWFSRGILEKLAAVRHPPGPGQAGPATLDDLTARELEILTLVCEGATDPEIAAQLALSRNTVRNHLAAIYRKLGVNRRAAAVVWARERALASGPRKSVKGSGPSRKKLGRATI